MAALKFKQNDKGEDLKEAIGMFSKEKEYVDFDKSCDCTGQVSCSTNSYRMLRHSFITRLHVKKYAGTCYTRTKI